MKWIKSSERLPDNYNNGVVYIRYNFNGDIWEKEAGDKSLVKELVDNGWNDVQWLDESETPSPEKIVPPVGDEEATKLINEANELLMQLRIKSEKNEHVYEKELYDVQMLLYKALDKSSPSQTVSEGVANPILEISREQAKELAISQTKIFNGNMIEAFVDCVMRENYLFRANRELRQASPSLAAAQVKGVEDENSVLEKILNFSEEEGWKGCTYGDTEFDSLSAAYGYNTCLQQIKSFILHYASQFRKATAAEGFVYVEVDAATPPEYSDREGDGDTVSSTKIVFYKDGSIDLAKFHFPTKQWCWRQKNATLEVKSWLRRIAASEYIQLKVK